MDSTWTGGQPGSTIVVGGVAALDSSERLGRDVLVGKLDGEIVAVITVRDGLVVAKPFRATAAVIERLKTRRAALLAGA